MLKKLFLILLLSPMSLHSMTFYNIGENYVFYSGKSFWKTVSGSFMMPLLSHNIKGFNFGDGAHKWNFTLETYSMAISKPGENVEYYKAHNYSLLRFLFGRREYLNPHFFVGFGLGLGFTSNRHVNSLQIQPIPSIHLTPTNYIGYAELGYKDKLFNTLEYSVSVMLFSKYQNDEVLNSILNNYPININIYMLLFYRC